MCDGSGTDSTYGKIIAEYQASLEWIGKRIRQMKAKPGLSDEEKRRLAVYCRMRYEHRQAIKSMSRYLNK